MCKLLKYFREISIKIHAITLVSSLIGNLYKFIMEEQDKKDSTNTKIREELNNNSKDQKEKNTKITETNAIKSKTSDNNHIFLLICIIGVTLGIFLEILNAHNRKYKCSEDLENSKEKYWVYSKYSDVENKNGVLKHVHLVLERLGYQKSTNDTPWTLLWSHDYPFRSLYPNLHRLKPYQKVNKFPGTGFITNKVDFAITESKYIPKAFKLPQNKVEFLKYAADNKNAVFLEKHNQHRGVYLKNVSEIFLDDGDSFVQEYVQKPFLVDGHKFDIGVYVVLTSVKPLRVYWYKGDVLFRYCPAKYYPFDPKDLDKYVIRDDYLPTWEVPSLAHPYTALGFGMKDAFDHYALSKGKNTSLMWEEVQRAISDVFIAKENLIVDALKQYPSQDNFFEMMRFDLIVDEDLKVHLLEANMSPNLSSAHYPPNQLLYEQVLYNLFGLTGVASHLVNSKSDIPTQNMVSSQKNIAVWSKECSTLCKEDCSKHQICGVCKPCLSSSLRSSLLRAHTEFLHRGDFRRLFPPPMKQNADINEEIMKKYSPANRLQYLWFQGKCNRDVTWCT